MTVWDCVVYIHVHVFEVYNNRGVLQFGSI